MPDAETMMWVVLLFVVSQSAWLVALRLGARLGKGRM
jgi:hypothetical protein